MRRRASGVVIAILSVVAASVAEACSPAPSVYKELPLNVARTAYVIDGIVTRPFNAAKRQAEIITATRLYVGDANITRFEIARDRREFERRKPGSGFYPNSCDRGVFAERGTRLRMFVLYPVRTPGTSARAATRWGFGAFDSIATGEPGLTVMLAEAARLGRLRITPPRD